MPEWNLIVLNMQEIIFTLGLPASGKTQWAKEQLVIRPGVYKLVCKDDLRRMIDDGKFSKGNEKFIIKLEDTIIMEALREGRSVIVHDTNFGEKHVERFKVIVDWAKAMLNKDVKLVCKDFTDVPLKTCLERDPVRQYPVGKEVIMQMYNRYLKKEWKPRDQKMFLGPYAIICDLDGTIAKMGDRGPFEWSRVGEDELNEHIKDILLSWIYLHGDENYKVIFVSGRDEVCRAETQAWLNYHLPKMILEASAGLFMRPQGDTRPDDMVKKEIYEREIEPKYNVKFVLDDRLKVCRMWHELGLNVLRVGDPDADF